MKLKPQVVTIVDLKRKPGYLYFIDGDGDVSRIRRAIGHYPGPSGPKIKVALTRITKDPGFWYYLKGNQVLKTIPSRTS